MFLLLEEASQTRAVLTNRNHLSHSAAANNAQR